MNSNDQENKSERNHELLIRLDEKMVNMSREFRDYTHSSNTRITELETKKIDKAEAIGVYDTHRNDDNKVHADFEVRIRNNEDQGKSNKLEIAEIRTQIKTWGSAIGGGLAILQVLLHFWK